MTRTFSEIGNGAPDRGLDFIPCERGRLSWRIFSPTIPGALAFALSALFGVWILYLHPAAPYAVEAPAAAPAVALASNPYGGLFDPRFSSGSTPVSHAQGLPLKLTFESILPVPAAAIAELENVLPMPRRAVPQFAESAPLPLPRPAELGCRQAIALSCGPHVSAAEQKDRRPNDSRR